MNALLAATTGETYHRLIRLQSLTEWWQWLLLGLCLAAVLLLVTWLWRRDTAELQPGARVVLLLLRLTAFAGILFYFFGLEKGTEQKLVKNSRVLLLFDTSLSMGLPASYEVGSTDTRTDQMISAVAGSELIGRLRQQHDVAVYRFDQGAKPVEVALFPREGVLTDEATLETEDAARERRFAAARQTAIVALVLLGIAVLSLAVFLLMGARIGERERASWALLASVVTLIAGLVVFGVANLRCPEAPLLSVAGLQPLPPLASEEDPSQAPVQDPLVDWPEQLAPRGVETRLGEAVRFLADKERGGSAAGMVLFSDGRSNAGVNYEAAVAAAQDAGIPLFTVGLGDANQPANVAIDDLEAPQRVTPGDDFNLKGYLKAFGLAGRFVEVQLVSRKSNDPPESVTIEGNQRVALGEDGQSVPVSFTASPNEVGSWIYELRVKAPSEDRQEGDNKGEATVQVVDEKTKVLLVAGGPMREYRFLRDVLFRDKDIISDVYLQTGKPGISQESDDLLFEFPTIAAELFEYDCIVAFDPDWLQLDQLQMQLLERWVSENAGGLVIVSGPVFTPEWTRSARSVNRLAQTIKALYPVTFLNQGSVSLGKVNSDRAWPLDFTRDGREAKFLWLEDESLENEKAWADFDGVFGYQAVKDLKQGAKVYANFSDPQEASLDNEQPIFMAGHYYGAGRVFFLASGEMWRLRELDPQYFARFYTKLIRWTSAGRLLRDSSRGVLLVDEERPYMRDQVTVTAILTDAQHQPLQAEQVPAILFQPNGRQKELTLERVKDATREGTFVGYFSPLKLGAYRIEMKEAIGDGLLSRQVTAILPQLETTDETRNDLLLQDMAQRTSGAYFIGAAAAADPRTSALYRSLAPRDQVSYLPGRPDMKFQELLMGWLMALICGTLSLQWLIRRLSKLA